MSYKSEHPPGEVGGRPRAANRTTAPAPITKPSTVNSTRREAALRLPPLGRCGCVRDPLCDKHRHDREPSDKQLDGYRAAVQHLSGLGLTPAALLPELRGLWRRGDRTLAFQTAEAWGLIG